MALSAATPTQIDPLEIGVYLPRRAGALAGVSGQSIGQWARHGLVTPTVYEGRPANLYSYFDVAESIVVRWLLDQGFRHTEIRAALEDVRYEFPRWPLLNAPLGVGRHSFDDRGALVKKQSPDVYVDVGGRAPGQIVIKPVLLDNARDMLRHGGWLASALSLQRIEVKPLKLGGQPSLRGRRWTVEHVARLAADDEGRQVLIERYGLEPVEVDEAVAWADAAAAIA
jgi:uncharacterized protein (DUF433 family)/DNA-binding transcriptional MerR regulator